VNINTVSAAPGDGVVIQGLAFQEDLLQLFQWYIENGLPLRLQGFSMMLDRIDVEAKNYGPTIKIGGVVM
jgi:hypothetical protein